MFNPYNKISTMVKTIQFREDEETFILITAQKASDIFGTIAIFVLDLEKKDSRIIDNYTELRERAKKQSVFAIDRDEALWLLGELESVVYA